MSSMATNSDRPGASKAPRQRQESRSQGQKSLKRKRGHEDKSVKRKQDQEDLTQLQVAVDSFDPKSTPPTRFSDLPLSETTARGLRDSHFTTLTDVQSRAIPLALKGCDILGAAKTGSGKTLAFLVPLLEKLHREKWSNVDPLGALVLSPTRELATQTFKVLHKIGRHSPLSAGLVIGGHTLSEEAAMIGRMNILVSTPGRMLQHLDQTVGLNVDSLQVLVLDEADRIMDMGFKRDVDAVVEHLPRTRQTMLFSATQSKKVSDLARLSLKDPEYISVHEAADEATPSTLQQHYFVTPLAEKLNMLWGFIKSALKSKIIVFVSTVKQVRFIYETFRRMRPGISLLHLHGRQKEDARRKITAQFAAANHACLIATDVVARGVDFPAVNWVVQVDAPEDADTYIHRVGRTARFERNGNAMLFLDPSEKEGMLKRLEHKKVPMKMAWLKEKNPKNIQSELQSMCFKDHEVKYLAQKAFITYVQSVHKQKDKEIFQFDQLDLEAFAKSLGLAGAPQIKFEKGEDAKRRKNVSRALLAAELGSDESGGEEEGSTKAKKHDVRTKTDKMFDRTNQDVLSTHYRKLVDDGEEDESDAEDFLKPKRVLRGDELDEAAGGAATAPIAKVIELGHNKQLVLDSKRREKLVKSKKKLLKFKEKGTKLVFDDEGNARPVYELQDEDQFREQGPAEELRKQFVDTEADKVREADVDDKALARERLREKKLKKKARERGEEEEDDEGITAGPRLAAADDDDADDPLEFLRSLPVAGGGERSSSGHVEEEEEDETRPNKKRKKTKTKKWFETDADDEEMRRSGPKVIEMDHEPDTLEDYEALAAGLLDDN